MLSSATRSAFRHARRAVPISSSKGAVRCLNLHEYNSMDLFKQHGIQTPKCFVADTPEEAEDIYMNKMNTRKSCHVNDCSIIMMSSMMMMMLLLL